VSLVENGTHVLFGTRMGPCTTHEKVLAREVISALTPGMLCLADRGFYVSHRLACVNRLPESESPDC
jgi:hypothetical protein